MRRYRSLKNRKPINRVSDGARDARSSDRALYAAVHARSGNRCEVVLGGARCPRPRMIGLHHVTKRAQGGAKHTTADAAMDVCKAHHDLADNAHPDQRTLIDGTWVRGRLRVVALGGGTFKCWLDTTSKASARLSALAQAAARALETDVRDTEGATFHQALRQELKGETA